MSVRLQKPIRRLCLAFGLLLVSATVAHANPQPDWWCYNGTCCQMNGGAVTTNCSFTCSPMLNGEVTYSVKSASC